MARRKETIWQADFSLGATRPEALERDDTDLVQRALKEAKNTIALTPGALEIRPGTVYVGETAASAGIPIDLGSGREYDLHLTPTGLKVYDSAGAEEASFSTTWTSITGKWGTFAFSDISFWVVQDPDGSSILIGSRYFPIQVLSRDSAGVWSFGPMAFAQSLAGATRQPYWRYEPEITIQPSARTGAITVTASSALWKTDHNGMAIRYVDREITLGTKVSDTVINATVVEELPPTYDLTVASVSGYQKGEAVEHSSGGQGIITNISGSIIKVLATANWDGFAASGTLIGPNANQAVSGLTSASPAATYLWDTQMQSPVHGYAGHAARHKNRLYLGDFPGAPQGFCASSAGSISDFKIGVNDADGFAESLGSDTGGDLKFIVSAEDLLFFTTRGLYYQQTRDGTPVTPSNIGPIAFSRIGCAEVEPKSVDDGAVFVDAVGNQVYAAVLAGDVYRSWRARPLSSLHSHLLTGPNHIGATSLGSEAPEQFIYVTNTDGTVAVCQWDRDAGVVGWRPWDTDGTFKAVYQVFGKTYAVVDRTINSVAKTFRERFESGIVMDCVASVKISPSFPEGEAGVSYFGGTTAFATHLDGHEATVYLEGWDLGDRAINASGKPTDDAGAVIDYPDYTGIAQIGLPFSMQVTPWARRSINTQRGRRNVRRTVMLFVAVQDSSLFAVNGEEYGGYRVDEDLSVPPPARTEEAAFILGGGEFYPQNQITKPRPGPFRLTRLGYRVVV